MKSVEERDRAAIEFFHEKLANLLCSPHFFLDKLDCVVCRVELKLKRYRQVGIGRHQLEDLSKASASYGFWVSPFVSPLRLEKSNDVRPDVVH